MSSLRFDELGPLAAALDPYEVSEEHGGYALTGPLLENATDEELIQAARDHDLAMVGERLEGGYRVRRGFGRWKAYEDGEQLDWTQAADEPGLEPVALIQYDETLEDA